MSSQQLITLSVGGGAAVLVIGMLVFLVVRQRRKRKHVLGRLDTLHPEQTDEDTDDVSEETREKLKQPLARRIVFPVLSRVGRLIAARAPKNDMAGLRMLLDASDAPPELTGEIIYALQFSGAFAVGGLVLAVAGLSGTSQTLTELIVAVAAMVGFMLPRTVLKSRAGERIKAMTNQLPDVLDLLLIMVEAGLSIQSALVRTCERLDNDLTSEIRIALREYNLGVPLPQAMRDLAERIKVPSLHRFVRVIVQSGELGSGLAPALRVQSDQLRLERKIRAQEKGQKAPVKMILPLVGCTFPTIFLILLGPAALLLLHPKH